VDEQTNYQITVEGAVSKPFARRLGMLATTSVTVDRTNTVLTGSMADQAALLSVLTALYDMGFELVSVEPHTDGI
jgi:hypothetical protein